MAEQHFWRSALSKNPDMPYVAEPVPGSTLWFKQRITLQRWCADVIGRQDERWSVNGNAFQFASETDMLQFALAWQGNEIERADMRMGDPELPRPPISNKLV